METIFLSVLNMSLTASFVIAVICLVRLPLKKAPKAISYALWAVVGFRLVCPFTFDSVWSLLPFKSRAIPQDIAMQITPRIDSGIVMIDHAVSTSLPAATPVASINPLQIWIAIGAHIWILGVVVMLVYSFATIVVLKRRLCDATLIRDNLHEADNLRTPFVIGLFRPKIYIPAELSDEERRYIVLHEQTHIRRCDHAVKMFAYFVLCLHWFNPLAWVAFILMSADMEMSCDERVMKELGGDIKNAYSLSLVRVAAGRKILNGSPLAFGEGGMKERVKNVLHYKKPSRVVIVVAVALVAVLSMGLAADRVQSQDREPNQNQALMPWIGVPQKSDWPVHDMNFGEITFGADRDWVVYRMGREPDREEEDVAGGKILSYHMPPVRAGVTGEPLHEVPGSDYEVTFWLDSRICIKKHQMYGVYRIHYEGGGAAGGAEMTGRRDGDGKLSGVLAQYGGPNAVEREEGNYILWYDRPDDTDKRMWFEVKDGELTQRMGIVCLCDSAYDRTEAQSELRHIPLAKIFPARTDEFVKWRNRKISEIKEHIQDEIKGIGRVMMIIETKDNDGDVKLSVSASLIVDDERLFRDGEALFGYAKPTDEVIKGIILSDMLNDQEIIISPEDILSVDCIVINTKGEILDEARPKQIE